MSPLTQMVLHVGVILALGFVVGAGLNFFLNQKHLDQQKIYVASEVGMVRARLEEQLNSNLFLIYGMAAYISNHPNLDAKAFDQIAQELMKKSNILKNIAAAPDFAFRFVYPLEGNSAILGVNYRNIPEQWERVLEAKLTGKMTLAGPIDLIQGGQGLAVRIPVFLSKDSSFWGLVSAVINMDSFVNEAGLNNSELNLQLALRGKDGKGPKGEVFWGNVELFEPQQNAIRVPVSLPSGSWVVAAIPKKGWDYQSPYSLLVSLITLLVTLLLLLSSWRRMKAQQRLVESQMRLKAMSDASLDALIMTDNQDRIQFWNPAAELLFGFSEQNALGEPLHKLLQMEVETNSAGLEHSESLNAMNKTVETQAVHQTGRSIMVEQSTAPFLVGGKRYAVTSLRDITARKLAERHLTEMATTDELTGLANRRHFISQAQQHLQQSKRYQHPFSLMMFDIDFFKRVNDSYGHAVGDQVLMQLGAAVPQVLRITDVIGRLGGEEFAVAMPETDLKLAEQVAERLRIHLMDLRVPGPEGDIQFTVSLGVTQLERETDGLEALMQYADDALYQAKREGRNRVVSYHH